MYTLDADAFLGAPLAMATHFTPPEGMKIEDFITAY
jgi:hypothetical protein